MCVFRVRIQYVAKRSALFATDKCSRKISDLTTGGCPCGLSDAHRRSHSPAGAGAVVVLSRMGVADIRGACPCPSLTVRYLNLPGATTRAAQMDAMLRASLLDAAPCTFAVERLDAVQPQCARGRACRFNSTLSPWSASEVARKLERAHTRKFSDGRRAGSLGNWLSRVLQTIVAHARICAR